MDKTGKNYPLLTNKINKNFLQDQANSNQLTNQFKGSSPSAINKKTSEVQKLQNNISLVQPNLNHMRNNTESDVSYEGNTIDMIKILNKKQEGRRSRINIRRKQYQKYQNPSGEKYPRFSADRFTYQVESSQKQNQQNFSTMVHTGATALQNLPNKQRNTMLLIQNQQQNNSIVGIIILIIFIIFSISELFFCSMYLNQGQSYQNLINIFILQNLDDTGKFKNHMFVQIITIYLVAEFFYTVFVFYLIKKYPLTGNKIVDKQTSSYKYITTNHTMNSGENYSMFQSARFKGFIIGILTVIYFYSLTCIFYESQLIYFYWYFEFDFYIGYQFTTILQITYFGLIMPQVFKYLFLEKVISNQQLLQISKQSIKSQCSQEVQFNKLTKRNEVRINFNLQNWWMKISVIIFSISIFYSLCFDIWLGVAFIAKSSLYFLKVKYRIDSFYIQQFVKLIMLIRCFIYFIIIYYDSQDVEFIFLDKLDVLSAFLIVLIGMCLSRIIAHIYLKEELYKYFYNEMHFLICIICGSIILEILLSLKIQQIFFLITENMLILIYYLFLILILWKEGGHRAFVMLNMDQKRQSLIYQMEAY